MKTTALRIISFLSIACLSAFAAEPSAPIEKTKPCFQCNGTGKMKCPAPTCQKGEVDCPGSCLQLTKGTWVHMEVAGHPPTDVWQKFNKSGGGWTAYNQNHVGHIIQMVNGEATDVGVCPVCHGKAKVKCTLCNSTGEVVCSLCEGKKTVPESWTTFDNPKMKNRPTHFKMKDGTTLIGKKTMEIGTRATIKTEKGDVEVNSADILEEIKTPANSKR
jgi:uncharacterized protein YlaI